MSKKMLAALLAVMMVLSLVPMTALATDAASTPEAALRAAIDAAEPGETVTLTEDVAITSGISVTKNLTLDLNGHQITVGQDSEIWKGDVWSMISVNGTNVELTIKSEASDGGIIAKAGDSYAIDVKGGAALTINCTNGTKITGNVHAVYVEQGSAVINGGRYDILQHYDGSNAEGREHSFVLNCLDANQKNGTASITVNSGVVVGVDPSNTTSDLVNPTNYVPSTSIVVKARTEEANCQVPNTTCKSPLKAYTVAPAAGLTVDKPVTGGDDTAKAEITGSYQGSGSANGDNVDTSGNTASFDLTTNNNLTAVDVEIPAATAETLTAVTETEIKTDVATVALDSAAVSAVVEKAKEEQKTVVVSVKKKTITGTAAAVDVQVKVKKGDSVENVLTATSGTSNASITISIPKPANVTDTTKAAVWYGYISGEAFKPVQNMNATYEEGKGFTFTTSHLSTYALYADGTSVEEPEAVLYDANGEMTNSGAFTDMVSSAADGSTIKLNKDVTLAQQLNIANKKITIDGDGKTISAGNPFSGNLLIYVVKGSQETELTLKNVKVDAAASEETPRRVIVANKKSKLIVQEGTVITGGVYESCSGVYIYGGSSFEMTGGEIAGNRIIGANANDGDWQYTADLWIPSDGTGIISGGHVGNAYSNANEYTPENGSAGLTITGTGSVDNVFAEAYKNNVTTVVSSEGGTIGKLFIAMDYDEDTNTDTRLIVSVEGSELTGTVNVTPLRIPDGVTATVVNRGEVSTVANNITIGTDATLIIPEGVTVQVEKNGETIPTIANNGTVIVDGKLIAGASGTDGETLNFTGNGAVAGKGEIDLATKDNFATVKLNPNGGTGVDTEYKVYITGGTTPTFVLPVPTRGADYTFMGWFDLDGNKETTVTVASGKTYTFTARWEYTGSSVGPGGSSGGSSGTSGNITVTKPANGTVTTTPSSAKEGDKVTVTVKPDAPYYIVT
ncbi:hypothetical protein D5272_19185, partial [bacterium D16-76]|nr:hypothetical protein [bacterium D16-76]